MEHDQEEVFLMAALSGNNIVKIVKLTAREVRTSGFPVTYKDIHIAEEAGVECPDGVYEVHVIGLAPMRVWRINGYWLPVEFL